MMQQVFGKPRVVRDCGYITSVNDNQGCVKRTGTFEVQNFFCSCTDDLCNESVTLRYTPILAITSIIVTLMLRL